MHHLIVQLSEGAKPRDLLEYLRAFGITRVVFPAHEYGQPSRDAPADNESTRRLRRPGTLHWGNERVRQVIDGDGPVPHGLDPEAIAAARRIARRLNR